MGGKWGWGTAALYNLRSSSLQTHAGRAIAVEQKKLVEARKIETAGIQWRAVRTDASCERRVADDLELLGFHAYCPLGRKNISWIGAKQLKKKIIRQFPVFSRYIFAGHEIGSRRELDRDAHDKIQSILGNSDGHIPVPPSALNFINDLELAGQWDDTKSYVEKSPLKHGTEVRIIEGPFAGFSGFVDALQSEKALWALIDIFGRSNRVKIDPCQVELV